MQAKFPRKAKALFEANRYTILHGGRGSGKSQSVARALLIMAAERPMRVLCCREIQRSIRDSVHRLLADIIDELRLNDCYRVMETQIQGANGDYPRVRGGNLKGEGDPIALLGLSPRARGKRA